MSIRIDAPMCSYVRALFEHPSKWYESYQENGTKYLKRRTILDDQLQEQLSACAGEIFLCGIPADTQAEKIAEVAALVGEVYILRYKVHFSGASRGFAYLQYTDPKLMPLALEKLPFLFRMLNFPMIKVCPSRNSSVLLLRRVSNMLPIQVCEALKKLISFNKFISIEVHPGYFEYQIIFKCNEEAVRARREILKSILKFGPNAVIIWDSSRNNHKTKAKMLEDKFKQQNTQCSVNSLKINPLPNNIYKNFHQQNMPTNELLNNFTNMKLF